MAEKVDPGIFGSARDSIIVQEMKELRKSFDGLFEKRDLLSKQLQEIEVATHTKKFLEQEKKLVQTAKDSEREVATLNLLIAEQNKALVEGSELLKKADKRLLRETGSTAEIAKTDIQRLRDFFVKAKEDLEIARKRYRTVDYAGKGIEKLGSGLTNLTSSFFQVLGLGVGVAGFLSTGFEVYQKSKDINKQQLELQQKLGFGGISRRHENKNMINSYYSYVTENFYLKISKDYKVTSQQIDEILKQMETENISDSATYKTIEELTTFAIRMQRFGVQPTDAFDVVRSYVRRFNKTVGETENELVNLKYHANSMGESFPDYMSTLESLTETLQIYDDTLLKVSDLLVSVYNSDYFRQTGLFRSKQKMIDFAVFYKKLRRSSTLDKDPSRLTGFLLESNRYSSYKNTKDEAFVGTKYKQDLHSGDPALQKAAEDALEQGIVRTMRKLYGNNPAPIQIEHFFNTFLSLPLDNMLVTAIYQGFKSGKTDLIFTNLLSSSIPNIRVTKEQQNEYQKLSQAEYEEKGVNPQELYMDQFKISAIGTDEDDPTGAKFYEKKIREYFGSPEKKAEELRQKLEADSAKVKSDLTLADSALEAGISLATSGFSTVLNLPFDSIKPLVKLVANPENGLMTPILLSTAGVFIGTMVTYVGSMAKALGFGMIKAFELASGGSLTDFFDRAKGPGAKPKSLWRRTVDLAKRGVGLVKTGIDRVKNWRYYRQVAKSAKVSREAVSLGTHALKTGIQQGRAVLRSAQTGVTVARVAAPAAKTGIKAALTAWRISSGARLAAAGAAAGPSFGSSLLVFVATEVVVMGAFALADWGLNKLAEDPVKKANEKIKDTKSQAKEKEDKKLKDVEKETDNLSKAKNKTKNIVDKWTEEVRESVSELRKINDILTGFRTSNTLVAGITGTKRMYLAMFNPEDMDIAATRGTTSLAFLGNSTLSGKMREKLTKITRDMRVRAPSQAMSDTQLSSFLNALDKYGQKYGFSPDFLAADAIAESGLRLKAVSSAKAAGLVQFMDATWRGHTSYLQSKGLVPAGLTKEQWLNDPDLQILYQATYMRNIYDQIKAKADKLGVSVTHQDLLRLTLVGYNAGPETAKSALERYFKSSKDKEITFAEIKGYVESTRSKGSWSHESFPYVSRIEEYINQTQGNLGSAEVSSMPQTPMKMTIPKIGVRMTAAEATLLMNGKIPPSLLTILRNRGSAGFGGGSFTMLDKKIGGYDQSTGELIAAAARRTGGNKRGCWDAVDRALLASDKNYPKGPGYASGAYDNHAYQALGYFRRHPNYREIKLTPEQTYGDIPTGAIFIYQRGAMGASAKSGHIEIYDTTTNAFYFGLGPIVKGARDAKLGERANKAQVFIPINKDIQEQQQTRSQDTSGKSSVTQSKPTSIARLLAETGEGAELSKQLYKKYATKQCAATVSHILRESGIDIDTMISNPNLVYSYTDDLIRKGYAERISVGDLKAGDLIIHENRKAQRGHIGMMTGDNQFVHASTSAGRRRGLGMPTAAFAGVNVMTNMAKEYGGEVFGLRIHKVKHRSK